MKEAAVQMALDRVIRRVEENARAFGSKFPAACSSGQIYEVTENDDWTNGFFTGMLWLAYERSGNRALRDAALLQVDSFWDRMKKHIVVDHHDMGFLYSPSCVAAWLLEKSEKGKEAALMAASQLMGRFQEKGQFFQAWGKVGDRKEYRLIIDCLMNLPLLFWASKETGEECYRSKALAHIETALRVLIRPDASTYHTYFFDPATGEALYGATRQGNRDDSIWARGQAWAVYGTALSYGKTGKEEYRAIFRKVTDCFISHLPKDRIPYWDFDFTDGSSEPRDSSAAAIAACGLLEMAEHTGREESQRCRREAESLLEALTERCLYQEEDNTNGVLLHSTYSQGRIGGDLQPGADECSLWGDYFYMEALVRLQGGWQSWW